MDNNINNNVVDNIENLVFYKEADSEIEAVFIKDVLQNNNITFHCVERIEGVRYKKIFHQFYIHKEDKEKVDEYLRENSFADLPWNPDSDNSDTEAPLPWYLDKKKQSRANRIFFWCLLVGIIVFYFVYRLVIK